MQWALSGNGMVGQASTFHLTGLVLESICLIRLASENNLAL